MCPPRKRVDYKGGTRTRGRGKPELEEATSSPGQRVGRLPAAPSGRLITGGTNEGGRVVERGRRVEGERLEEKYVEEEEEEGGGGVGGRRRSTGASSGPLEMRLRKRNGEAGRAEPLLTCDFRSRPEVRSVRAPTR
jgi:hypothetical protein